MPEMVAVRVGPTPKGNSGGALSPRPKNEQWSLMANRVVAAEFNIDCSSIRIPEIQKKRRQGNKGSADNDVEQKLHYKFEWNRYNLKRKWCWTHFSSLGQHI